ncbi:MULTISPECIES: RRXRR domain-containing protein, partial [Spirulina sp. CCY15215]|uniref:RRXRR domain-containing protein n=1 Tax=Spirulina sp. CCY15215 TaxID=2767591 RepID=UPI001951408A
RRALRRSRRNRKTRYRQARFLNRKRPKGWLAPSLKHRVDTTLTWVNKLIKLAPITGISQELVRFDLQQLENPEISGIEYQQGKLV